MSDLAREIATRHCPGESELPLSDQSRAVWIDSLTDAIRAALVSAEEIQAVLAELSRLRSDNERMEQAGEMAIMALRACRANGSLSDAQRALIDEALETCFTVKPEWRSHPRSALSQGE